MFTHCTCSPVHETLNPNLDAQPSPAAQAHSPPHTPVAQSVTPPLHPSRDSRVAQATSAPRPPTAAAPPPLARRPPSPRHRTRPRPTSSDGAARGDPLARGDPRRPDPVPAPLSSSPTGSMEASGASRSFLSLPGEQASRLRISPSPQWPSGRPPHRLPLRQTGGRGAAASSPAPGRGAVPAGAGVGWGKPPLLQGAWGERIPAAVAEAPVGAWRLRWRAEAPAGTARRVTGERAAPSSWRRRRGEPVLQSSNQQFG